MDQEPRFYKALAKLVINMDPVVYQIRLKVSVTKNGKIVYRNDQIVPNLYVNTREKALEHIRHEIDMRLKKAFFFLCPNQDYDIVKYQEEATMNTFLKFGIIEVSSVEFQKTGLSLDNINRDTPGFKIINKTEK